MQRAFSFDRDDTTTPSSATAYRPLPVPGPVAVPVAVPLAAAPPRPPIHHHHDERLLLRDQYDAYDYEDSQYHQYQQQYHHHNYPHRSDTHARYTSASSLASSDSSVSSVARGGLGAPSPRSFQQQQHLMYSTQQQQHGDPQWGAGSARIDGPGYPGQDDRYDRVAPAGASERYFAMRQHSSPANSSPMSQAHVPLMGGGGGSGTPASRFADPMPSPPPPPHLDAPPPSPPPHRDLHNRRVLNDPVGGHYTDNPYTRYSTTWDPQLVARQLQATDSETLVFSDDEDDARGRRHAGAMATTTTTTTAAGAAAGAALVGRPANHASPTVERGGLLGSEGGSTMRLNGQSLYMWSGKCGREGSADEPNRESDAV